MVPPSVYSLLFTCYPLHFIQLLLYLYFTFYFSLFDKFMWYPLQFIRFYLPVTPFILWVYFMENMIFIYFEIYYFIYFEIYYFIYFEIYYFIYFEIYFYQFYENIILFILKYIILFILKYIIINFMKI